MVTRPLSLFDHIPIPIIFIDAAERGARANDPARALLGLPSGEAAAQDVIAAMGPLFPNGTGTSSPVLIGGTRYRVESHVVEEGDLSGRMWLFHVAAPDATPVVSSALNRLEEGIMLIAPDETICLWNKAFVEMLDLPASLFETGAPMKPLIQALAERGDYGPGDPTMLADQIAANIGSRKPARGERQLVNGTIIAVEWIALDDGYFLFHQRNVTSERTASRFKDELIATVSHELRTPLTVINGALGLLRGGIGGATDARVGELIEVAYKNSDRLTRLVNDLLDIDKLQSGALDFQFEVTDMGLLLVSSVEQNMPYSEGLGVAIELEVPEEQVVAEVDRGRLMQVMSNLLSNAAKFSPAGSRVRVRLQASGAGLRISVIDKGHGMSAEFCRRLFTRFAQEKRGGENAKPGTGLGLAICKSIVERHHGRILVDTQENVGTIFHVDLPYGQEDDPDLSEGG